METAEAIKMLLPKREAHYWVKKEGIAEKEELLKVFNLLSDDEKIKYNLGINPDYEAPNLGTNNIDIVANKEEIPNIETKEPTIPVSEVSALVEKMVAEQLAKATPQAPTKQVESPAVTQIKNELFDDLPEIRNFKQKERIYVLCDGSKPRSFGIPTRHKDNSPLQYINKETGETFALFYSATQTSFFKEKHKGDSKVEHVTMIDGMLKTYETDIKLQKFLAINPHNKANGGNMFEEYNPSAKAENSIEDFELDLKARNMVVDLPYLKQDAIARLLCVDYKEDWTSAEVKKALFEQAVKSPKAFITLANDKSLEIKGVARTAVHRGILVYKNYKWFNEVGEVLCEVARNEDEYSCIADFFMSGEGRSTYDFVKNSIG